MAESMARLHSRLRLPRSESGRPRDPAGGIPPGAALAVALIASLVAAACGASPRVEREVAARNALAAQRSSGSTGGTAFGETDEVPDVAPGLAAPAPDAGADAPATTAAPAGTTARTRPRAPASGGPRVAGSADPKATVAPGSPERGPTPSLPGTPGVAGPGLSADNGGATDLGVTATSIKIGGTFLNGSYLDKYGQVAEQAASAYFKYVNDQGGVFRRRIVYLTCDTAATVQGTNGCLTKLARQDKVFIMGPSVDWNLDTVQPTLARERLPWVGSSALYAEEFTSPWMYPTQQPAAAVGGLISAFAVQRLGARTIGVSYLTVSAGPACLAESKRLVAKLGARIVAEVPNEESSPSLSPQVERMRAARPDAVVFCNDPINTVKFIQASNTYRPPRGFVGGFVAADDVAEAMGPNGIGSYGFTGFDFYGSDTPDVRRFREISEFYFPSIFHHFYSQAAYAGAVAIVEALRKAGPQLTRDRFLAALLSMRDFRIMGLRFDFTNLAGSSSSGIMLQVNERNRWKVASDRFTVPE